MSKPTILVVEDEAIVAADLEGKLGRLGYEVIATTPRGEDAVTIARTWRPDLTLMDIRLAGSLDGIGAADKIRGEHGLAVVYLTAHFDPETLKRARVTEPFGYILKPFEERELQTVIEMALFKHAAEVRLRESEGRYRALCDAAFDGVVMHQQGDVLEVNEALLSMLGYTREEMLGQNLMDLAVAPESFDTVADHVAAGLEGPYEVMLRRKDGTRLWVEVRARNVTFNGRPVRVGTLRDISVRKEMEEAFGVATAK